MPLKRTPPTKKAGSDTAPEIVVLENEVETPLAPIELHVPALALQYKHDSEPDLHAVNEEKTNNITLRFKRKHYEESNSANMESMMGQMKSMFAAFSLEQANRFKELQTSVTKIEKQNEEISHSMEFISHKYDEIARTVKELEEDKRKDKKHIQELEERVELLERKLKGPAIEIRNLPVKLTHDKEYETKDTLTEIVKNMGQSISVDIQDGDIKDVFAIKSKSEDKKTIYAEFTTAIKKEKVIDAVIQFNKGKKNTDKLKGEHLKINDAGTPVYVAEALTRKTQKLLYTTRQFVKAHGFANAWSYRGSVYVRKVVKQKPIKINDEEDLQELLMQE